MAAKTLNGVDPFKLLFSSSIHQPATVLMDRLLEFAADTRAFPTISQSPDSLSGVLDDHGLTLEDGGGIAIKGWKRPESLLEIRGAEDSPATRRLMATLANAFRNTQPAPRRKRTTAKAREPNRRTSAVVAGVASTSTIALDNYAARRLARIEANKAKLAELSRSDQT